MSIQNMMKQTHDDDFSGKVPTCLKMGSGRRDTAVPSKRSLQKFAAENQSDFSESNNIIRFNINSGALLDLPQATFSFDLTNTTGASNNLKLDGSCASIIDTFRVYSQDGTELERIQEYALIDSVLGQYDGDIDEDSLLCGAPARKSSFPAFAAVNSGTTNAVATVNTKDHGLQIVSTIAGGGTSILAVSSRGGVGYDQLQSDSLDNNVTKHYEMPFRASGWFNPSMNKLLPPNCSFVVELQLNTAVKAFLRTGSGAPAYKVNNTYLNIPAVTINDPVCLQHLQDKMSMGIQWSGYTYSHHVNTTTGTSADTIQINARAFDLNALVSIFRNQANISVAGKMAISKRSIQGISQYQYTLGSTQMPAQPCKIVIPGSVETVAGDQVLTAGVSSNVSQCFSELRRVLHHVKRVGGAVNVSAENFAQSETNQGTGLLSVDVAAYNDASVMSGLDTKSTSMPVSLEINKSTVLTGDTLQCDTFALCGVVYSRMPDGRLSSSY